MNYRDMFYAFLFPRHQHNNAGSLLILGLRLLFGVLLMMHGFDKLENYATLSMTFPDFMYMGSKISLLLVMFVELVCALAFIIGFLFRLAIIPMIISMAVAFLWVHRGSIMEGELAFVYLVVFCMLALSGPGNYSIDAPLGSYLMYKDDTHTTCCSGAKE